MKISCLFKSFLGLALFAFLCASPLATAEEGAVMPLENATDFVNIVNNQFPGLVTPASNRTSAEAGTGAPSGQNQTAEPASDAMTWQEYLTALDELNLQVEAKEISESEWHERTQAARARFLKGEKERGHGFNRLPDTDHSIDTRAIQIEKNLIDVGQSQQQD